jgi:hypothetical protein
VVTKTRKPDAGATWAQIGGAVGAPVGAALAALLVLLDWISVDLGPAVLTGLSVGAPVGAVVGLVVAWRRAGASATAADTASDDLDALVLQLRSAVLQERRSDRSLLANRLGGELDLALKTIVRKPGDFAGWRLAARTSVKLERLHQHFLSHRLRLVLLGEPGSGKSLAGLRILEHVNTNEVEGRVRLAEVFPLASWGAWHATQPDDDITEWMANALALQWGLTVGVARRVVASDVLIPIFDGLDEVEEDAQKSCVLALNSYVTARADRAFIVCCRAKEYLDLAPTWVAPEERAELVIQPLELHEVREFLDRIPLVGPWQLLKDEVSAAALGSQPQGEPSADRFDFLRSPLHLTVALRAYEDGDPQELLTPDLEQARMRLWGRYMARTAGVGADYSLLDAQRWLATIASLMTMHIEGSPVFWLHWLHWIDRDGSRLRSARRRLALTGFLVGGLASALLRMNGIGLYLFGLAIAPGLQVAIGATLGGLLGSGALHEQPMRFHWKQWFRPSWDTVAPIVLVSLLWGVVSVYVIGPRLGVVSAILVAFATHLAIGGGSPVDDKIRESLGSRGPYAILKEAAKSGCVGYVAAYALGFLGVFLLEPFASTVRNAMGYWLLYVGIIGLYSGFHMGWDAVIWHFWLRLSLAREDRLPLQLVTFLRWTSLPEREWVLRVGGSYRFRHRELQELLAHRGSSAGAIAGSS